MDKLLLDVVVAFFVHLVIKTSSTGSFASSYLNINVHLHNQREVIWLGSFPNFLKQGYLLLNRGKMRAALVPLPLLSQMTQMMDFCSRKQNEPLIKTTVCAMTFPCITIRRIVCNLGTQVLMPTLAVGSSGSTGDGQSTSPF